MTALDRIRSFAPGAGRRTPRAYLDTDAPSLSLDGQWGFRLLPEVPLTDAAPVDDGDGSWGTITVPGHWQLQGHGSPAYTNVRYPFPVEPPFVPDDNPTGEYLTRFELPADWAGQAVVLRFEGADAHLSVWLNGHFLGWSTGSRLAVEFALTDSLRPGANEVAVRVSQWAASSYLEDQDMWWMSGLFRSVSVQLRPAGGIEDAFVSTDYDETTGSGRLRVETTTVATLSVEELGLVDVSADVEHLLAQVEPWSAEVPRLYDAVLRTASESVRLRLGFRSVRIDGDVLKVNGSPVLLRGVNRHEWHPDTGRTLDLETMRRDVVLMKQHNINAVRTSHYPPHPEFVRLCDELGLYVVLENDLETHGFLFTQWEQNPSDDARWRDAYLDRMRRTLERDKNSPSVILWSLGNESDTGRNLEAMSELIHRRDPSRPVHYEGDWDSGYVDVYSRMYATHAEVDEIGRHAEPETKDAGKDAHRRSIPFLQCEYVHAMGNGPGGVLEYQQLFEKYDRIAGGFVWEWIDHGIRSTDGKGREFFAYGGDFGEPLHDSNFVADGLLFPDRTPSPGLVEFAKVVAPLRLTIDASARTLVVRNLHQVRDTSYLRFVWTSTDDGVETGSGELTVTPVAPGTEQTVALPPDLPPAAHEGVLTVQAVLAADEPWAPAGHEVAWGQEVYAARPSRERGAPKPVVAEEGSVRIGNGVFDRASGALLTVGELPVLSPPRLDLWRAPTDNDEAYFGPDPLANKWRTLGLDRVVRRVHDVRWSGDGLVLVERYAPAAVGFGLVAEQHWSADADGLVLRLDVRPDGTWPVILPRLGLRLALPASISRVDWFGLGPGESYPDSITAVRLGRWSRTLEELQTPYLMPQENGNRSGVRWAELAGEGGPGLRVEGSPTFELTARRWTSEALAAARHTPDLEPGDRVWLNLDIGQSGLGTGSCGPGVLEDYELRAEPRSLTLRLRGL